MKYLLIACLGLFGCNKCLECTYNGNDPYTQTEYEVCHDELPRNTSIPEVSKELEDIGYDCMTR